MKRNYRNDIRLSLMGDLDGMTVGELRKLLEEVSDDTKIEVDWEVWPNSLNGGTETYYEIVIRRD